MYKLVRSFFFLSDAEAAHYAAMNQLRQACKTPLLKKIIERQFAPHPGMQPTEVRNLSFINPVGLAAGFDKNAAYLNELKCLGFGFVEIGTVTPRAQEGNEKPRLFRLRQDKALLNRMGFNNDGKDAIAQRLGEWRKANPNSKLIIGGNIGKNKSTPNEYAYLDYDTCFRALHPYVDYFVVNVSSPNTPGLRELQEKDALHKILTHLQGVNKELASTKPIWLKIAPDLGDEQLKEVAMLAKSINLDGLVATNTTLNRSILSDAGKILSGEAGAGGVSGKPLLPRTLAVVKLLRQHLGPDIPLMASGGIFTGPDAKAALDAGANLVAVWTGFVYEGPSIVKNITGYLASKQQ